MEASAQRLRLNDVALVLVLEASGGKLSGYKSLRFNDVVLVLCP